MRARNRVLLGLLLLGLGAGPVACGRAAEPPPAEPAIPRTAPAEQAPSVAAPRPANPPRWIDPMRPHPSEARFPMAHVEEGPLTVTDAVTTPAAPAPPVRDLDAELRGHAGDVASCVPAAEIAALPPQVAIDLEATIVESGIVSRAAARSATLSPAAVACVRARIDAARFLAPVPGAPRTASTRIALDRQPAPPR